MAKHLLRGRRAERLAQFYLQCRGFKLVAKNFRCRLGEIDLVMRQSQRLVFVEVRYRSSNAFGGAAVSITPQKQQRLIRTAQTFLQHHHEYQHLPCRFDVVAIGGEPWSIQWITNAFEGE